MKLKTWIKLLIFIIVCINNMFGGVGKLSGIITDKATGEPLVAANVMVVGKVIRGDDVQQLSVPVGTASDLEGFYYIINLEPADYVIKVMMMGYGQKLIKGVHIESGRTITLNVKLSQEAVAGETVTVYAKREVVKLDVSSSETNITKEDMENLPVSNIGGVLNLNSGVSVNSNSNEIFIRHGGADQIGIYIDGFSLNSSIFNSAPTQGFNQTSVKEISIKTGGFTAEYGNLRSGSVEVITESGGDHYSLSVDSRYTAPGYKYDGPHAYTEDKNYLMYGSDWSMDSTKLNQKFPYPTDYFEGWPSYSKQYLTDTDSTNDMSPTQRRELWNWRHKGRPEGEVHDHIIDATLSGPVPGGNIPFLGDILFSKMNFMLSFKDQQEAYVHPAIRDHYGLQNSQFKLTYKMTPKINIISTYMSINESGMGEFPRNGGFAYIQSEHGSGDYNDTNNPIANTTQKMYGLKLKHILSNNTFYEVKVNRTEVDYDFRHGKVRNYDKNHLIEGEYYTIPDGDTLNIHGLWDQTGNYTNVDTTLYGGQQMWCPEIWVDETMKGWPEGRIGDPFPAQVGKNDDLNAASRSTEKSSGSELNMSADFTHQHNKYNQFKVGVNVILSEINRDWFYITKMIVDSSEVIAEEWYNVKYSEKPKYYGGYVQDKIEIKGLIANIGVRLDAYDANSDVYSPDDPFNSYFYADSFKTTYVDSLPTEKSKVYFRLSPRLGISHPLTKDSKIFFNYGHAYTSPRNNLRYGYRPKTKDESRPLWVGNPNLKPYKTVQYELGYEHVLFTKYLAHGAIYYKDASDQSYDADFTNYYLPYSPETQDFYYTWNNRNFQEIIGMEFTLTKRVGEIFTGNIKTEFSGVKGGQIGFAKQFVADDPNNLSSFSQFSYPDDIMWQWQPTVMANLIFRSPEKWGIKLGDFYPMSNMMINTIIDWKYGSKITWNPENKPGVRFNMQNIDHFLMKINISKDMFIGKNRISLYCNIYNPVNRKFLNIGILRGMVNNPSSEIYQYYDSLKDGDRIGDYKQSYLNINENDRPGEGYILRVGGPMRVTFGLKFDFDWL